MMTRNTFISYKSKNLWILLAILGILSYITQGVYYANHLRTMSDEGTYLYKGLLFARGDYVPFEPYGPWTNKMPLSFLLPGYIQHLFGPSLPLARYVMIAIGTFNILVLGFLAQRIGNLQAAAITIWLMALDGWLIKTWTLAISQGWTALALLGSLAFLIQKQQPSWIKLYFGSFLVVLAVFIRQNMILALPVILGYIFWEYGQRYGIGATITVILAMTIGHAIWWPDILSIWAPWLPPQWTPFLNPWRVQWVAHVQPHTYPYTWSETWPLLFAALRSYGPDFTGVSVVIALLSWRRALHTWRGRVGIFLAILWLWLVAVHAWATLGGYCPDCLQLHFGFFAGLGWLAFVASWPFLKWKPTSYWLIVWVPLLFGSIWSWAQECINQHPGCLIRLWLIWRSEQFNAFFIFFGLERPKPPTTPEILPWLSLILVLFILLFVWGSQKIIKSLNMKMPWAILLKIMLLLMMPSPLLTGRFFEYQCSPEHGSVLQEYHRYGLQLSDTLQIQKGIVYWAIARYNALLLYLPSEAYVPPPMLNGSFNYYTDGFAPALVRLGFWNAQLKDQWFSQANMWVMLQAPDKPPPRFPYNQGRIRVLSLPNCKADQNDLLWIFIRSTPDPTPAPAPRPGHSAPGDGKDAP